jgi:hypothetical protein
LMEDLKGQAEGQNRAFPRYKILRKKREVEKDQSDAFFLVLTKQEGNLYVGIEKAPSQR